ncbi:hypothetical protein FRC02_006606, partial [Tulasnella sp. 418]
EIPKSAPRATGSPQPEEPAAKHSKHGNTTFQPQDPPPDHKIHQGNQTLPPPYSHQHLG